MSFYSPQPAPGTNVGGVYKPGSGRTKPMPGRTDDDNIRRPQPFPSPTPYTGSRPVDGGVMPPGAPEPRPFTGGGGDSAVRTQQPFPMPGGGDKPGLNRPQPFPMPGGEDKPGLNRPQPSPNPTPYTGARPVGGGVMPSDAPELKAQDFKNRYTKKVKKAVSKRKNETSAQRRERKEQRNR